MASSCHNLIEALKDCLRHSDCVTKQGHSPSACLKERELFATLPEECKGLRKATYECKRGMLDMRRRFRGNMIGSQFEFTPRGTPSENEAKLAPSTDEPKAKDQLRS